MARLEIQDLGKCFSEPGGAVVWALRHANLAIAEGEFLVLVGPSGAGKSTLLRLLAGLEAITEGLIRIDGQIVNDLEPKDRDMAMVFQNQALYPHLTAFENMALGLILRKVPKAEIQRRVKEVASTLALTSCLDRRPDSLSGGERQRVALGRALVRRPRVLLLDEPLSNLDAPRRVQLRDELASLHKRFRMTVVCASHDQAEAMALGDRLAVLNAGRMEQVGEPLRLYRQPSNVFVAQFLGMPPMNLLPGRLVARPDGLWFQQDDEGGPQTPAFCFRLQDSEAGPMAASAGRPVLCGIRPEDLACARPPGPGQPAGRARVERVEPAGAEASLRLRLTGGLQRDLAVRVPAEAAWRAGDTVALQVAPERALFFDPDSGVRLG